MTIKDFLRLLRPEQYYKNLVVFLAIYFSGHLLNLNEIFATSIGFVLLCILSSANYAINDIADRDRDKHNKEKADRPLASGKISVQEAWAIAVALLAVSLSLSYLLNRQFFYISLGLFGLTTIYSFMLKNELFVDIIVLAVNYVLRAVAGAAIIGVWASPWLLVGTFFLALFLASGKRRSEIAFLKAKAESHRPLLQKYSEHNLMFLLQMSATVLLVSYALYSFLGNNPRQVITLPIALYIILRYLYLVEAGAPETRIISNIFKDKKILAGLFLFLLTSFAILYMQ